MLEIAIDTLRVAKRLREAGFTAPQAEAVIAAVQEGTANAELVTKADIAELRNELKAKIADLCAEMHRSDLRLEVKIEAIKPDILNRVFGLIPERRLLSQNSPDTERYAVAPNAPARR